MDAACAPDPVGDVLAKILLLLWRTSVREEMRPAGSPVVDR
jgi:hypothetical protein